MTRVTAQGSTLDIATTSPTPVYRIAALSDLEDVAAIETERFGDQSYPYFALRQLFDLHGDNWLIAEADGMVLGHVLVALTPDRRAWLLSLAVTADRCGRGYGSTLLEEAIDLCRQHAIRSVLITVRPTNQSAYNLYKRLGFEWTAYEECYFGIGEPRDVLEYKLDQ
ncbi:GNAT family N-acetyltransferase [Nocardia iowensis]|uniref:GNAT family N-acetyltransferase n=1 Tax=Nocardia iowensis TaxID=204891 RepID=A0ABX8RQW1_NOCIO|nr:GNAT family N-acetyltransferase [Nocardia iowensis]QXN92034.1 GNAT family N-acetyltransferase [Nocardia iowensis]